jgi:hypothetical protein
MFHLQGHHILVLSFLHLNLLLMVVLIHHLVVLIHHLVVLIHHLVVLIHH